jgi:lipopolysaccharide biosynthesis glycosyltransferase
MKMENKVVAVCVADNNNLVHYQRLLNSLRKFHTEEELPLVLIGEEQIKGVPDNQFFYRATPILGQQFLQQYDTVVKLDADQIITGKIDHTWEGDFDVAVVNNSNPKEMKTYPVAVWDIHPLAYVNCGFVVMKSKEFVKHWLDLCYSPHFQKYQMKEQDLLNILVHYGNYRVKMLDASEKWHGLIAKQYWAKCILKDGKLILPKNEEWPKDQDKEIVCIHFAGGNDTNKGNYNLYFKPEVSKWIDKLIK